MSHHCYSLPALSLDHEFSDLNFVAGYVDNLLKTTGREDYRLVCEWDEDGPYSGRPPVGLLYRLDGVWERRHVLVSSERNSSGHVVYTWSVGDPVNSH
jgi:hypothetical protein